MNRNIRLNRLRRRLRSHKVVELTWPVLEQNYRFLTLQNIWVPDLSGDAIYVAGYPATRTKRTGPDLKGNLFVLKSQFRQDTPDAALRSEDAVTKGIDFFVHHREGINHLTGENVGREGLFGMSGCSVWGYRARGWTKQGVWSPEAVMKVIGVQSSFAENDYIRAKSWGSVLGTLVHIDEQIGTEVKRRAVEILTMTGYHRPAA